MEEELCLVYSCTTNTVLRELKYFQTLKKSKGNVTTIAGRVAIIVGSGRATIVLPMGTQIVIEDALLYPDSTRTIIVGSGRATIVLSMGTHIVIEDALLYPDSTRTLLSYKDIRRNGFHVETNSDNKDEYLFITKHDGYSKHLLENSFTIIRIVLHIHQTRTTCCILGNFLKS
jgi:hypothetical protein